MDERVVKFRVGVMVLSTLIIAGILVLLFGDARSLVHGSYTVYIHFADAPGVSEGTPLRKSGILIGRVTNVRFAEQGGVIVTAKIDGSVKLYHNEVPEVSGSLLGGDVVIQFVRNGNPTPTPQPGAAPAQRPRGPDEPSEVLTADPPAQQAAPQQPSIAAGANQQIQSGDYIEGRVSPNAFQVFSNMEGDLGKAINSLTNAGDEVGKLASYVNNLISTNDDQIKRIVGKTETMIDSFQAALNNFEDILGNPEVRDNLKKSIADLPELLTDTRSAMNTVRTTVESVDRNLRNLEGLTGPLGERGGQLVDNVDNAVAKLDSLLGELSQFSSQLNRGEGSIGQLMRNPELYQHLNAAACNIETITRELKPILADARVFSDKISRHPELLGIRGAIQKSPGTK